MADMFEQTTINGMTLANRFVRSTTQGRFPAVGVFFVATGKRLSVNFAMTITLLPP